LLYLLPNNLSQEKAPLDKLSAGLSCAKSCGGKALHETGSGKPRGGAISIRVAVLGSGSSGNSTFIATSAARILVDAGFSYRELVRRMAVIGEHPQSLAGILITHEHSDHISGLAKLAKQHRIPVYISALTREALPPKTELPAAEIIEPGKSYQIGDVTVEPFTIPHDAVDPVAYRFSAEGLRVAVATDLGYLPENVKDYLRGCHCMVVESNHDLDMLRNGPYPWYVKQRVMARTGHLSNTALGEFLQQDFDGEAQVMVLAHLSAQNNHPELARMVASSALEARNAGSLRLVVSSQHEPSELFQF
jgi:phosphoribosyl 1,2-cyclic phosphodiesterase